MAFGCPYEGEVRRRAYSRSPSSLRRPAAKRSRSATRPGWRIPRQVGEFFASAVQALEGIELTAHFHNTRGQGLANVLAALEHGVDSFESAFGELGGSPLPPGSTGNISTEDLVSMLEEMGIDDRRRPQRLIDASSAPPQELLGRPLGAHLLSAGRSTGGGSARRLGLTW